MAVSSPLLTWDRDLHHQRPWLSSPWTWPGAQHQLSSCPASRFWGLHKHSRAVSIYLHLWARMNLLVLFLWRTRPTAAPSALAGQVAWQSFVSVHQMLVVLVPTLAGPHFPTVRKPGSATGPDLANGFRVKRTYADSILEDLESMICCAFFSLCHG